MNDTVGFPRICDSRHRYRRWLALVSCRNKRGHVLQLVQIPVYPSASLPMLAGDILGYAHEE
jgi:hypothetical protein